MGQHSAAWISNVDVKQSVCRVGIVFCRNSQHLLQMLNNVTEPKTFFILFFFISKCSSQRPCPRWCTWCVPVFNFWFHKGALECPLWGFYASLMHIMTWYQHNSLFDSCSILIQLLKLFRFRFNCDSFYFILLIQLIFYSNSISSNCPITNSLWYNFCYCMSVYVFIF